MIRSCAFLLGLSTAAAAQDFQVGSRAKAMGGSYTAFGDDPVAIWTNPAGTAAQPSQLCVTYQSFVQYEFDSIGQDISPAVQGEPEQGLLDPPITPAFAGIVVQIGDPDLEMAASVAYVRPFQIKYVYAFDDPVLGQLFTQTDQQFTRLRSSFAVSARLSEGSPWLTRVSVGAALDFVYTKYKEIDHNPAPVSEDLVYEDSESSAGWGAGVLATVYETDAFRLDAGAAYNSSVDFHFDLDRDVFPVWDWPSLASAGVAVYVGDGYPLRLTFDAQAIGWERAVGRPEPGLEGFEDTLSFSAGGEYRFTLGQNRRLYARAGVKSYDTPWGRESDLPAVGQSRLRIETKGDRIEALTLGLGLYWSRRTAEGQSRVAGLDVAVELFGETPYLMGVSFTWQFD